MEKRLILSLGLSFAVLYIWAALGPKEPAPLNNFDSSQVIHSEEFASSSKKFDDTDITGITQVESIEAAISNENPSGSNIAIEETETVLENEHLVVTFTNKGGNIKQAFIKWYDVTLPLTNLNGLPTYNNQNFTLTSQSKNTIEYRLSAGNTTIIKTYTLSKDDYLINSAIKTVRNQEMSNLGDVSFQGFTLNIPAEENSGGFGGDRNKSLYEYVIQTENKTIRKNNAYKFSEKNKKSDSTPIKWVGFRDRYFCAIVKPEFETSGYSIENKGESVLDIKYRVNGESLQSVSNPEWTSVIYVGPEKVKELKKYDQGFEQIQRYYKLGLFDGIAKIIQGLMHLMYKLIPNWGVSIILVSLLIYGCTYPMTIKSMSSMRKMQSLQPKMAKIKEKHANNPQKMNQEMMALYKTEKVNPLGGMFAYVFTASGIYWIVSSIVALG